MMTIETNICHDCRPCEKCNGEGNIEASTPTRKDGTLVVTVDEVECPRCEGASRECAVWQNVGCSRSEGDCDCECVSPGERL